MPCLIEREVSNARLPPLPCLVEREVSIARVPPLPCLVDGKSAAPGSRAGDQRRVGPALAAPALDPELDLASARTAFMSCLVFA